MDPHYDEANQCWSCPAQCKRKGMLITFSTESNAKRHMYHNKGGCPFLKVKVAQDDELHATALRKQLEAKEAALAASGDQIKQLKRKNQDLEDEVKDLKRGRPTSVTNNFYINNINVFPFGQVPVSELPPISQVKNGCITCTAK